MFSFERLNKIVNRLNISVCKEDFNETFSKVIFSFFKEQDKIVLFGVRENLFWEEESYVIQIKKNIEIEFSINGKFEVLFEKNDHFVFVKGGLNQFQQENIKLIRDFWNCFEFVFIFKATFNENILNDRGAFSFESYLGLLTKEEIVFSIIKPNNELISIDSANSIYLENICNILSNHDK